MSAHVRKRRPWRTWGETYCKGVFIIKIRNHETNILWVVCLDALGLCQLPKNAPVGGDVGGEF